MGINEQHRSRILVVEEDPQAQQSLQEMLGALGFDPEPINPNTQVDRLSAILSSPIPHAGIILSDFGAETLLRVVDKLGRPGWAALRLVPTVTLTLNVLAREAYMTNIFGPVSQKTHLTPSELRRLLTAPLSHERFTR